MSRPDLRRPATAEALVLWVMHRLSEAFPRRAILKGGMALRLVGCPRSTTHIDYVFAPGESKRELANDLRDALGALEDARIDVTVNSKMVRATVELDGARIQVEANVAESSPSEAMSTGDLAMAQGMAPRVVRILRLDAALAHKLAAWNERRLHRDLYDVYFLRTRLGAEVDHDVLQARLARVENRRPGARAKKRMSAAQFARELRSAAESLDPKSLDAELAPILPRAELAGLAVRIRSALVDVAQTLEPES